MENSVPKKPIKKIERLPRAKTYVNVLGYFLHFKITQVNLDHKKLRHIAAARKISDPRYKRSPNSAMLDKLGVSVGEIKSLNTSDGKQIRIKRHNLESFTLFLGEVLAEMSLEVGDILQVHFPNQKGELGEVSFKKVNLQERDFTIEFGEIVSHTFKNLKDPIWQIGSELIEKALRVTNPDDPEYYGSSSGCLSFWSYRSYNAREEIYIQWRWNSVGELYVEAVSNKYAWPKISVDGINHLLDNGWSGPREDSDDDLPNFFRTYEDVDVKKVAHHLMRVLRDVYLVKRDWIWLFNPFQLVEKLFEGKSEDDFQFKPEAFFIFDEKQTYKRRCEMGVQLSEDVLPPKWLRPWL